MNKKLIILTLILSTGLINGSSRKNLKRSLEQSLPEEVDPKFTSLLNAPEIYESFPDLEGLELILPVGITQKLLSEKEKKDMRLKANRERQKKRRAVMTPEQKAELKSKQKEYYIAKKATMTHEQKAETLERQRKLYQIRRAAMTLEELEKVRQKNRDHTNKWYQKFKKKKKNSLILEKFNE